MYINNPGHMTKMATMPIYYKITLQEYKNPGHMTKMAAMPIYGKKPKLLLFCPVTVLANSQVSNCYPLGYSVLVYIL